MPVLRTDFLSIGYAPSRRPATVIADDLNLALRAGELVCLVGPNGAGKSTLIRTLVGMQPPLSGQIWLGDDDLADLKPRDLARRLSVVLTERVSAGNLTAYALVALGRHPYTDWTGHLTEHDEDVVRWALETVGAKALAARAVNELSDGERQKVMIARALAQEPALIVLDEPTAFLDLPNRVEIMRVLRHLTRSADQAILLSTHDLDLALRSADTIWLMPRGGDLQVGAPEDLVLSGAFEAAFHSDGVIFDRQSGAFKILTPHTGQVNLVGDGLAALWTRRALEREGFSIDAAAPLRVDVVEPGWRTTLRAQTHDHASISELIMFLRRQDGS